MRHVLSCHPEKSVLWSLHKLHRPRTAAQCNHRQSRSNDLGRRLCRLRARSGCGRGRSANIPVETVPAGPAAERLSPDHGHAPIQEPSPQRMPNIGAPAFWTAVFVTRAQPSPHSDVRLPSFGETRCTQQNNSVGSRIAINHGVLIRARIGDSNSNLRGESQRERLMIRGRSPATYCFHDPTVAKLRRLLSLFRIGPNNFAPFLLNY